MGLEAEAPLEDFLAGSSVRGAGRVAPPLPLLSLGILGDRGVGCNVGKVGAALLAPLPLALNVC